MELVAANILSCERSTLVSTHSHQLRTVAETINIFKAGLAADSKGAHTEMSVKGTTGGRGSSSQPSGMVAGSSSLTICTQTPVKP